MNAQWPHFWIHLGKDNSALIRYIPSAERGVNCEDLWYDFLSLRPECELVHGRSYEAFTDAAPLVLEVAYRSMVRVERRLARSSQHTIGPCRVKNFPNVASWAWWWSQAVWVVWVSWRPRCVLNLWTYPRSMKGDIIFWLLWGEIIARWLGLSGV